MIAPKIVSLHRCQRLIVAVTLLALVSIAMAVPGSTRIDSLNFVNAEIPSILSSIASMSGANIVVSPDVKGTLTLQLRDVTVEQALETITSLSGCAFRLVNGVYIVTKGEGEKPALLKDQEYLIVKLELLKPADAIGALSVAYADLAEKSLPDNRLVISGDIKHLEAAKAMLLELDRPTVSTLAGGMTETTYQLKSVVPKQAKEYLDELYHGQGLTVSFVPNFIWAKGAATPATLEVAGSATNATATPVAAGAPATPEQTTTSWDNNILMLRGPQSIVDQAVQSLDKIDLEVIMASKRCTVKRIFATQAIAYLLGQYAGRGLSVVTAPVAVSTASHGAGSASIGMLVERDKDGKLNIAEPIGDFVIQGPQDVVKEATAALEKIDIGPERIEHVYALRFLQAAEAQTKLLEIYGAEGLEVTVAPSNRGETQAPVKSDSSATVGDNTVATGDKSLVKVFDIVLRGPQDVVARAESLLQRLDVESAQISISSRIVSMSANDSQQLGIAWDGSIAAAMTEQQSGNALQLGRIVRTPLTINATINALQTKNKAKLISQPSTVVQNGREALIHVGDTIYYETLSSYQNGIPTYTTNQIDTGVTLKVLPSASNDGVITLEISSDVSNLVGFNKGISGADLPQISETRQSTTVQVADGETLIIGGLSQNGLSTQHSGVPMLGNLPLIGGLFSSKTTTPSDQELYIMVTPKLVAHGVVNLMTSADKPAPATSAPAPQVK